MFTTVLVQPLANGLAIVYDFVNNMGLAIIIFSILLRVILNPLTKPYMESMKKMKDIAPQLEKLKRKYKGDKLKLAQAQSGIYKQKGIDQDPRILRFLSLQSSLFKLCPPFTLQ